MKKLILTLLAPFLMTGLLKAQDPDLTPPRLISDEILSETSMQLTFSETLNQSIAQTTGNYIINNGITVTNASLNTNVVTLTSSPLTEGDSYTLTVKNIQDLAGNIMPDTIFPFLFGVLSENWVDSISDLKTKMALDSDAITIGTTEYKLTGEVIVTAIGSQRNQKWIQDATGAVMIDDPNGKITTALKIGDKIKDFYGTVTNYYGLLQFVPTKDIRNIISSSSRVDALVVTPDKVKDNNYMKQHQSELMMLEEITFTDADGTLTFENGKKYRINPGTTTDSLVYAYIDDVINTMVIPSALQNVAGINILNSGKYYISPRGTFDISNSNNFCGGTGTEQDPWQICTVEQLAALAAYVNAGNGPATAGKHYRLMNDLDLTEWCRENEATGGWEPIGFWTPDYPTSFRGFFHGDGKVIRNLTINRPDRNSRGLFGHTYGGGIDSLGLENVNVTGSQNVGALVGQTEGSSIQNCYATGNVTGHTQVGGLVGCNGSSPLQNCYATGSVTGNNDVGGLVGYNSISTIRNCYAAASVTGRISKIGGLVGNNFVSSTISNSYTMGSVTGKNEVGGLVGLNFFSTIQNSVAANPVVRALQSAPSINRIAGSIFGGTYDKNYALESMEVEIAGTPATVTDDLYGPSGESKPLADLQSYDFYNTVSHWDTIPPATAWSIAPSSGGGGIGQEVWTIWDTKSFPYFPWQNATAYPPVIRSQPQGASLCSGDDYTLRVEAPGEFLSYQWYFNGQEIPGAESDQLLFSDFSPQNEGIYTVKVSNPVYSVTSNNAILRVNSPARIISDLSHAAVCAGSDYTFSPDISGDHLSYQWYFKGQAIPGATGNRLALSDLGPANIGDYHVVVTGTCGEPVESRKARLWVGGKLPQPLLFEVPDVAYRGQPTRLHVGYDYGYQDVTEYTWSFGAPNDTVSAGNSPTVYVTFHTVTDSQRVSLRMVHDVCGAYEIYKDIRVESPTGMEELEPENVKLFPSPFRNEVHIRGAEGCLLQVISISGAVVYTKKLENAEETILTGHLPEGVYLFRLEKDEKVKILKGVKM